MEAPPSDLSQDAGFSILSVLEDLRKAGAIKVFSSLGQPKRFMEILLETGISGSTLTRRLDEFVKKGLVTTEYDPKEKIVTYKLTEKGQKYFEILNRLRKGPQDDFRERFLSAQSYDEAMSLLYKKLREIYGEKISEEKFLEIAREIARKVREEYEKQLLAQRI
jgi:DNA-binding HxlR family transcriptional regulator